MKIKIMRDPFCIIIHDCFGDKSDLFMREILKNQQNFKDATIVGKSSGEVNKKVRSNITAYYDLIYSGKRELSPLLQSVSEFFSSSALHELINSAPQPFHFYSKTNYHETQVSRYGDSNQKYDFHIDRIGVDDSRLLTFSYYLNKKPKKFLGGEIVLSNGLISENKIYGETNRHKITVDNDMMVIFDSRTPHCVMPTKSPRKFEDGRFSVQMWLGVK